MFNNQPSRYIAGRTLEGNVALKVSIAHDLGASTTHVYN